MICPECGKKWESNPTLCDCGYALGSALAGSGSPGGVDNDGSPSESDEALGGDPDALRGMRPDAIRFAEELGPVEHEIGGFLYLVIPWLFVMVGFAAYLLVDGLTLMSDKQAIENLNNMGLSDVVAIIKATNVINGLYVALGAAMLFSMFFFRRYARPLTIAFLVANILAAILDYYIGRELAAGPSARYMEIDEGSLVHELLGRFVSSAGLLIYFMISKRVEKTFR